MNFIKHVTIRVTVDRLTGSQVLFIDGFTQIRLDTYQNLAMLLARQTVHLCQLVLLSQTHFSSQVTNHPIANICIISDKSACTPLSVCVNPRGTQRLSLYRSNLSVLTLKGASGLFRPTRMFRHPYRESYLL